MSTKQQKDKRRQTKQIRIGIEWHKRLKVESKLREEVMSKTIDLICRQYFKLYDSQQNKDKIT